MKNPQHIRKKVDEFLSTGETIENIRDIWYSMKGDIEQLKPKAKSDGEWDVYVNEHIGRYLYKLYLDGDTEIYNKLNIITTGLTNSGYTYNTPIVLFSEKKTRALANATEALLCGRYDSTGQIPSFEAVKIAEYLKLNAISNEVYLMALTDYDPAGEGIYKSLEKKVRECLALLNPDLELKSSLISYGESYNEIINTYDTYTLSTNPKNNLNQVWIKDGKPLGVELNVVHDKKEKLEDLIVEFVDPATMEALSLERQRQKRVSYLLNTDKEYRELVRKVDAKEREIQEKVYSMKHIFTPIWGTPVSHGRVRKMTKLVE